MTCAIYCRLSREDRERGLGESESIQNQREMLAAYAAEQGWGIHDIYADEDYSGADSARPRWRALLRHAREGCFDIVLCKTLSRFTRDMEMVEKYIHGLFPLWGIRFVAVVDHVDTAQKGGKKARQIGGLINEWYLEDLSENIRAVLDHKRRDGQYIGSFTPYGYRRDPDDRGKLVVDGEAAAVVRRIFSLYLDGMGTHTIARLLDGEGIPSPARYKRQRHPHYPIAGEGGWSSTAVSRILRNETYVGTLVQGVKRKASYKTGRMLPVPQEEWVRVPNAHEPVVERSVFDAARRRLMEHTRSGEDGAAHLLAGKLRCADCGSAMRRVTSSYRGRRRDYVQCGKYAAARAEGRCTRHSARLDILTDLVQERVRQLVDTWYSPPGPQLQAPGGDIAALQEELRSLAGRREQLLRALESLRVDREDGLLAPEQFTQLDTSFQREKQVLEAREKTLRRRIGEGCACGSEEAATTRWLPGGGPVHRGLIDALVDTVAVGEKEADGTQTLEIRWKI